MNWQHTPDRQSYSKSDSDWQPGTKWDKHGARSANWTRGHTEPNSSTGKSEGPVLNPGAYRERNSRIRKEGEEKRKKLYGKLAQSSIVDVEKSEWEAYDGEYYGAGVEEENAEAEMEQLRRYEAGLPRDSYCKSLVLMESTEDLRRGKFSATVSLPLHSPVHGPFKSEAKTLEKAKYQAASKALDALGTVSDVFWSEKRRRHGQI